MGGVSDAAGPSTLAPKPPWTPPPESVSVVEAGTVWTPLTLSPLGRMWFFAGSQADGPAGTWREGAAARRPPFLSGCCARPRFVFVSRVNASPAACRAVRGVVVRIAPACTSCTCSVHIMYRGCADCARQNAQKIQVVHHPCGNHACWGTRVWGHGPRPVHIVHFWPFMHPGARTAWNWKTYRERSSSGRAPMR